MRVFDPHEYDWRLGLRENISAFLPIVIKIDTDIIC
jgi:hypothetical protein